MVEFLLHNTLGAWWVAKRKTEGKDSLLGGIEFTYLRYKGDGLPAAGTFSGWPKQAKKLRLLDPCMGSGHFLVTELPILVAMCMQEEGMSKPDACDAVLRNNLFGLEIDARCTQIAAFNLALAAWKLAGYHHLPPLNLACSGLGINARKEEWLKLANGDDKLSRGMDQLYDLFRQAPTLGSLIDPRRLGGDLLVAKFHELQPLLEQALSREEAKSDETLTEIGVTARGLAHAAEILADQFTVVATNVPYLVRGKQDTQLREFAERFHADAKTDLATCFVERCLRFTDPASAVSLVTPQNWLFLNTYKNLRKRLLRDAQWNLVARLGPRAFEAIGGEVVSVSLLSVTNVAPSLDEFCGLDVSEERRASDKARALLGKPILFVSQKGQLANPDSAILLESLDSTKLLGRYADCYQGTSSGDAERLILAFWEIDRVIDAWKFLQGPPEQTSLAAGKEWIIEWRAVEASTESAAVRGRDAWSRIGIAIGQVNNLPATLYFGEVFADSTPVIIPRTKELLLPIWAFCSSPVFNEELRRINPKLSVNNGYVQKVPFDLTEWQRVAAEKYPKGLPEPQSESPTQWLFNGHPKSSNRPLQVAVVRLLGSLWPRQTASTFLDCPPIEPDGLEQFVDADGVVCVNPIKGEQSAGERLRALLAAAFASEWTPGKQNELLDQVGYGGKTLEDWLRNGFFEQHCELFHQRPFIWHIWDGRRDGFSALVNYHRLNRSNLEKLTYTFVGDWIARQKTANEAGEEGSDGRLQAAQELKFKLEKIIEGEAPYDIFVRWKLLEKQPIGWEPDLNDGVRLNIRPFVEAGVLRKDPKINWKKDRGKDIATAPWYNKYDLRRVPDYKPGDRINDYHLTLEEKRRARGKS